jgi:hypothetical protein
LRIKKTIIATLLSRIASEKAKLKSVKLSYRPYSLSLFGSRPPRLVLSGQRFPAHPQSAQAEVDGKWVDTFQFRCGKGEGRKGRVELRNPDKNLKRFPPCCSQSPLQLCLECSISSNSRNLLCISTVQLLYTVKEKGGKNLIENPQWFKKSKQKPQV